jgi:hypothetical protein
MRWKILALLIAVIGALAITRAEAQGQRKRPIVVVRPDPTATIDWYDPLRWRPLTQAELRASERWVRRCVDGYALEHRPNGTVITPRMACRWALR